LVQRINDRLVDENNPNALPVILILLDVMRHSISLLLRYHKKEKQFQLRLYDLGPFFSDDNVKDFNFTRILPVQDLNFLPDALNGLVENLKRAVWQPKDIATEFLIQKTQKLVQESALQANYSDLSQFSYRFDNSISKKAPKTGTCYYFNTKLAISDILN